MTGRLGVCSSWKKFSGSTRWASATSTSGRLNLPLILLTGIVHFTGVLTMWELRGRIKEFFIFAFVLVLGVFGFFMSMDLFFLFILVRRLALPHVPAHCHLGNDTQRIWSP